ncbi:MAG: hypothetical protein ACJ74O_12665 [Frankiaceae bacterium]
MPGFSPDEVRGSVSGWLRVGRREIDRRRLAAAHERAMTAHRRAVRRATRWTGRYAGAAGVALVIVPLTHGWAELGWGATSAALAVRAGRSALEARRRRSATGPLPPALPPALPAPPPPGSAAWPALRRVDAATAALRRLLTGVPSGERAVLAPALQAATGADDAARLQAAEVAAIEATLQATHRDGGWRPELTSELTSELADRLAGLDRAADAVEELVAGARALLRTTGQDAASRLRAAVDEVVARSYGVRAAAAAPGTRPVDRP